MTNGIAQRELTAKQSTLQTLALRQLQAASETLEQLRAIPASQADREALADAAELVERGTSCLRDWFGRCPFDDIHEHG